MALSKFSFVKSIRGTSIIIATAILSWFAFADAVVGIARGGSPSIALRFAPQDSGALSAQVDNILAKTQTTAALVGASGLVRTSLVNQAINPRALRQLGYIADAKGNSSAALNLISLSTRSSRRDFGAQLWLIQNDVRAKNLPATLSHYDAALRSSSESAAILFPVLSSALDDVGLQQAFAPYIKTPPPWLSDFLGYAIGQGNNPVALALTIQNAAALPSTPTYHSLETQLLGRLAAIGAYAPLRDYYLSLKGAVPSLPVATQFNAAATDPQYSPMTWQLFATPGIEAGFESGAGKNAQRLIIFASSGARGVAARKLLYLKPGSFDFTQTQYFNEGANGASAQWQLSCLRSTQINSVWQSPIETTKAKSIARDAVTIPNDCAAQYLDLTVAAGKDQQGSNLIVDMIAMREIH